MSNETAILIREAAEKWIESMGHSAKEHRKITKEIILTIFTFIGDWGEDGFGDYNTYKDKMNVAEYWFQHLEDARMERFMKSLEKCKKCSNV